MSASPTSPIFVIDSHTAGEPTRVIIEGGPDLGSGTVAQQLEQFRNQFDSYRTATVREPRGSDVLVGAQLCPPSESDCVAGVIFFNNVGYLGMCGHGTIGVIVTLAYLNRLQPGRHKLETPVGKVLTTLHEGGRVSVENVSSYRKHRAITIRLSDPNLPGQVTGDIAWGGNWFYLVQDHGQTLDLDHVDSLTHLTRKIRRAVNEQGYPEIDHVELFGPGQSPKANARNFVLCPGGAYDRSPCGTGTSAKLACLAADGKLPENEPWIQESILGSVFSGTYRWLDQAKGIVQPTITGSAFITGEAKLRFDPNDPFRWGIC